MKLLEVTVYIPRLDQIKSHIVGLLTSNCVRTSIQYKIESDNLAARNITFVKST